MGDNTSRRRIVKNVWNILFIAALLLLIFSPGAKAWMLKQFLSVGLFKAEIKKENGKPTVAAFAYQDINGNIVSSSQLQGKVVFINFWATWCPPCRAEMPSLDNLYQQLKNDNRIVFLFLNEDDDLNKAKAFISDNHYSFPIVIPASNIPTGLFSGTLPTTVILDKEGKVVMKHEGIASYNNTNFIEQLKSLL
ncbi:MAG: TlpA family protein disulfide reductase [Flavisolibacter sp.]